MDNIEITVFDEINDYKEKIYFFNFRQWVFAILIIGLVIPTYIFFKDRIGDEITSYIVITIAGFLGFLGFVKIHELPAEKILPYWMRHYFFFSKPIHYITDNEYEELHHKKNKKKSQTINKDKVKKQETKQTQSKLSKKDNKKSKIEKSDIETIEKKENDESKLVEKLSKLTKEQQDALFKLLER